MNLLISYDADNKKTMIKIGEEDIEELTFDKLLMITNNVIDNGTKYELKFSGFEDNPDVEVNYRKVFEEIFNLENDSEIIDLKKQLHELEKDEN